MSVVGMAREVATAYDLPLKEKGIGEKGIGDQGSGIGGDERRSSIPDPGSAIPDLDIVLEDPDLCPRYVGAVAEVTVAPSPAWMHARLQAAGVRPISNIVDITNYVLLELGHPMHAFDLAR